MTDKTEREQVAKALFEIELVDKRGIQPWDDLHDHYGKNFYRHRADRLMASDVWRNRHAPAPPSDGDDVDAIEDIIDRGIEWNDESAADDIAREIIAAGFRRRPQTDRGEIPGPNDIRGIMADFGDDQAVADRIGAVISEHCRIISGNYQTVVTAIMAAIGERDRAPKSNLRKAQSAIDHTQPDRGEMTMIPQVDDPYQHEPDDQKARLAKMCLAITEETADEIFNLTAYLCAADEQKATWFEGERFALEELVSSIRFDIKYAPELAAIGERDRAPEVTE